MLSPRSERPARVALTIASVFSPAWSWRALRRRRSRGHSVSVSSFRCDVGRVPGRTAVGQGLVPAMSAGQSPALVWFVGFGDQRVIVRPLVAGIIGAGRSCTVLMISVLSIPRRYVDVVPRSECPSWR